MSALMCLVAIALCTQAGQESAVEQPAAQAKDVDRAEDTVRRAQVEAARYAIVREGAQDKARLLEKPILKWSNPSEGSLFGSVVLWTLEGRPEAVASIYRWYGDKQEFHAEIKSLSTHALKVTRDQEPPWDAQPADVKFTPLNHEAPAETEAGRLRQMREIARRFSATLIHPRRGTNTLRLLPQPVYRYHEFPENIVDGGLFAFVQGTDPEVLLIVEVEKADGGLAWNYAVSRMNMHELHVALDGKEVWSAAEMTWSQASSRRGPYAILLLPY
jgi:hypothetical protein